MLLVNNLNLPKTTQISKKNSKDKAIIANSSGRMASENLKGVL